MYELGTERTYADNSKYSNDRYDNGWSRGRRGGGGWGRGYNNNRGGVGRGTNRSGAITRRGRYKNTTALQIYGVSQ